MTKSEILKSIELRQSSIKDYLNCPLMFRFKHIEQIPEAFRCSAMLHGTGLHKVIHRLHTEDWELPLRKSYMDALEEAVAESDVEVRWKETPEKYCDNAIEILRGYRENPLNSEVEILFSEVPFKVKIHGHMFTGTIDQVRRNPDGTTELIDLKSSQQRPSVSFLLNDWQLRLYSYALAYGWIQSNGIWVKPQLHVNYASWYFLRGHEIRKRTTSNGKAGEQKGDPLIRTKRTSEDLRLFKLELKALLNSMLRDWHYPNPNFCVMCHYQGYCNSRGQEGYDLSEEEKHTIRKE
jgi:RecB family exonuclease